MEQVLTAPTPAATRDRAVADRPRVAVIASLTASLVNFRLDLLTALAARAEVLAMGPENDPATEARLAAIGVRFVRIPMARTGINPVQDMATLAAIRRELRAFGAEIVLPYTMKPIIYGCLAARLAGVRQRVPLCTGLGSVFIDGDRSLRHRAVRGLSVLLYRASLAGAREVLVYNAADAEVMRASGMVGPRTGIGIVPGSGINLDRFPASPPPSGPPVFLMIGRLLRDKGVREYIEAARQLRARHPEVRCQLLGPLDPNPSAIGRRELAGWEREGVVEYLGETDDVRPYLRAASVFVLPSYREGISRSVLEAMATGRAVVTTDAPGCADPVRPDETGFLVPARDAGALTRAMARFVAEPGRIAAMGRAARAAAEQRFDVHRINDILIEKLGLAAAEPDRRHP